MAVVMASSQAPTPTPNRWLARVCSFRSGISNQTIAQSGSPRSEPRDRSPYSARCQNLPRQSAGSEKMTRRILNLDGSTVTVAAEARLDTERRLEDAVAAHPEVLPSEDLGLGPLVAVARQLDLGA